MAKKRKVVRCAVCRRPIPSKTVPPFGFSFVCKKCAEVKPFLKLKAKKVM